VSVPVRLIMSMVCGSEALQFPEQPAPLRPAEAHSDRDDDEIARDLDHPDGTAHRGGGCAEHCGRDADHCDRGERLQERRGKRQHDAAPPRLAVGDEIGRDDSLAVTGTRGMQDAVGERQAKQAINGAAIRLGGADHAGEAAIVRGLLCQQPAEDAASRLRGSTTDAERALGERYIGNSTDKTPRENCERRDHERVANTV
jgi:hypothetical protein